MTPRAGNLKFIRDTAAPIEALTGVTFDEMIKPGKFAEIVHARAELFARLVFEAGWSYARVARYFKCDHTSVIHSLRRRAYLQHGLPYFSGKDDLRAAHLASMAEQTDNSDRRAAA
jgi:hypothetical protein